MKRDSSRSVFFYFIVLIPTSRTKYASFCRSKSVCIRNYESISWARHIDTIKSVMLCCFDYVRGRESVKKMSRDRFMNSFEKFVNRWSRSTCPNLYGIYFLINEMILNLCVTNEWFLHKTAYLRSQGMGNLRPVSYCNAVLMRMLTKNAAWILYACLCTS